MMWRFQFRVDWFSAQERGAFAAFGRTTDTVRVNAMAAGGGDRRLVEVRGVDDAYPLSGSLTLTGADSLSVALHPADGLAGAAVEPDLLDHLHLKLGDRFLIGDVPFRVGALISNEPDRLGRGFALGTRRSDFQGCSGSLRAHRIRCSLRRDGAHRANLVGTRPPPWLRR